MTPYIAQTYHDRGLYFAAHGYPFLIVDVRGRGNSEGEFKPNINEAKDGHDVVEWVARQPYCNGKVAMWGGSYGGYVQWVTAKELPPHLVTIVPTASPFAGVDFPMRNNIPYPYLVQWLTLVAGRTSQDRIFWGQERFWAEKFRQWFESGAAFETLDSQIGFPSAHFQEWLANPRPDAYWDEYNPSSTDYAKLAIPVLTITGACDGDQAGALTHYREHLKNNPQAEHYLVIGPWDHAGTRTPAAEFCGLRCGPESLIDVNQLHRDWYAWNMQSGPKPDFLQKKVAYYVMGAERWRYADSLEAITDHSEPLYLHSTTNPSDVFHSGSLERTPQRVSKPDSYVYDPRDLGTSSLESTIDPSDRTDDRLIYAGTGHRLVYHSAPFERDTEISGHFRLNAWLAIDQPDTDFRVTVWEIDLGGRAFMLTDDVLRARYRECMRTEKLIETPDPLPYEFNRFSFISRLMRRGHRLRLVIGANHSIYSERNYNSGGVVSQESMKNARVVTVRLFHDDKHPSALQVPIGCAS